MMLDIFIHHRGRYQATLRDKSPGEILALPYLDEEGRSQIEEWEVPDSLGDEIINVPGVGVIAEIRAASEGAEA